MNVGGKHIFPSDRGQATTRDVRVEYLVGIRCFTPRMRLDRMSRNAKCNKNKNLHLGEARSKKEADVR